MMLLRKIAWKGDPSYRFESVTLWPREFVSLHKYRFPFLSIHQFSSRLCTLATSCRHVDLWKYDAWRSEDTTNFRVYPVHCSGQRGQFISDATSRRLYSYLAWLMKCGQPRNKPRGWIAKLWSMLVFIMQCKPAKSISRPGRHDRRGELKSSPVVEPLWEN